MIDYKKLAETIVGHPSETWDGVPGDTRPDRGIVIAKISRFFRDHCIAMDISSNYPYDISSMGNPGQYLDIPRDVTMTLQISMGEIISDGATGTIDDFFQTVPIEAEKEEHKEPKHVGRFYNFLKNEES